MRGCRRAAGFVWRAPEGRLGWGSRGRGFVVGRLEDVQRLVVIVVASGRVVGGHSLPPRTRWQDGRRTGGRTSSTRCAATSAERRAMRMRQAARTRMPGTGRERNLFRAGRSRDSGGTRARRTRGSRSRPGSGPPRGTSRGCGGPRRRGRSSRAACGGRRAVEPRPRRVPARSRRPGGLMTRAAAEANVGPGVTGHGSEELRDRGVAAAGVPAGGRQRARPPPPPVVQEMKGRSRSGGGRTSGKLSCDLL